MPLGRPKPKSENSETTTLRARGSPFSKVKYGSPGLLHTPLLSFQERTCLGWRSLLPTFLAPLPTLLGRDTRGQCLNFPR